MEKSPRCINRKESKQKQRKPLHATYYVWYAKEKKNPKTNPTIYKGAFYVCVYKGTKSKKKHTKFIRMITNAEGSF